MFKINKDSMLVSCFVVYPSLSLSLLDFDLLLILKCSILNIGSYGEGEVGMVFRRINDIYSNWALCVLAACAFNVG